MKQTNEVLKTICKVVKTDNWNLGGLGAKEQNCINCKHFVFVQDSACYGVCCDKFGTRSGLLTNVQCGCNHKENE